MVHRQNRVVPALHGLREQRVGGRRADRRNAFRVRVLDGGAYLRDLLRSDEPGLAAVRIQRRDSDARMRYAMRREEPMR